MIANDFGLDFERIRAALIAQLPARRRHARRRARRRPVPVQGHDAARGVQQQQLHARAREHDRSTRACRCTWSPSSSSEYDLVEHDRRHPRHGVQGRVRRHPLEPELQAQAASCGSRRERVLCTDPYVTDRPRALAARRRARASPTCSSIGDAAQARTATSTPTSRSSTSGTCSATAVRRVTRPRVSVVIPVYNEGEAIVTCLDRIVEAVTLPCEVLVVFDTTRRHDACRTCEKYASDDPRVVPDAQHATGAGPARAIRYGIDHASAPTSWSSRWPTAATTPSRSTSSARLVERGVVVAAASRYMQRRRSRSAAPSSRADAVAARRAVALLVRPGRHARRDELVQGVLDRASSTRSASSPTPASRSASSSSPRRAGTGCPVAEIPTIWLERAHGRVELQGARVAPPLPRIGTATRSDPS